ncbi:glycyl-radical enzyme activating protein [Treponema sp. HNW]|uniref:glycyl-radical enzyme activating protein n=1 Tax=Treponema sp. HNW TaxID=3116654 RepID=UPI003D0BF89D
MQTAYIINIQRFSIHDGPGIRTTLFFKGCPLRCRWCHNPESQSYKPQPMHYTERCSSCLSCVQACPEKAIFCSGNTVETDALKCMRCGECLDMCPNNAREISGTAYTVDDLVKEAAKDEISYEQSGGGVTLSGGEVMTQPIEFIAELARKIKKRGMHLAIDTCGYCDFSKFEKILPYTDLFLYDMKLIDPERHEKFTGVKPGLILDNLKKLHDAGALIDLRIPIIGKVNDDDEEILRMCSWLKTNGVNPYKINLLPYHDAGAVKYGRLRLDYEAETMERPSDERMHEIKEMFEKEGFHNIVIGG